MNTKKSGYNCRPIIIYDGGKPRVVIVCYLNESDVDLDQAMALFRQASDIKLGMHCHPVVIYEPGRDPYIIIVCDLRLQEQLEGLSLEEKQAALVEVVTQLLADGAL